LNISNSTWKDIRPEAFYPCTDWLGINIRA
jgi:hypothetical protein